ncbi:MAG: O-antigen ligase family protein [Opitutaceae bacterium]|nr:O-antigen ligase family protein [Opitutaceae bacterium]
MAARPLIPRSLAILESLQLGVLALNLAWTTLCLGGYRPETMVVTSALTAVLLVLHFVSRSLPAPALPRWHAWGWLPLPFLAYAAVNAAWVTPVPWLGWHDWLWWAQMTAVFWVVLNFSDHARATRWLLVTLAGVAFVAVVLAAYQVFVRPDWLMLGRLQAEQFIGRASGPFGIPNSLAALLLLTLAPTVALVLRRGAGAIQRVIAGYLAVAFGFGLVLTASRGAWLAVVLVVLAAPLVIGRRSWGWRLRRLGLAIVVVGAVGVAAYFTLPTLRGRFETMVRESGEWTRPIMWRGAWRLFSADPAWGSGAGSYNVLFEKHRPAHFQLDAQWAHNDYLNTLSDYGLVGFGLFYGAIAVMVGLGLRRLRRVGWGQDDGPWGHPFVWRGVALGLAAFGLQLFVDFHLKIPALAMALAVLAALLARRIQPPGDGAGAGSRRFGQHTVAASAALGIAVGAGAFVFPHYRAEALRYPARQAIDRLAALPVEAYRDGLPGPRAMLERALAIDPRNAQAWADASYATSLWGHVEPGQTFQLGREAERQASRALALSAVVPEFWLRHSVALDMQQRWMEAGGSCIRAMDLAPSHAMVWYYYAYHLSLDPTGIPQARAAVAICLRLDPANGPAQLLRQQLAARE